jgi:hypothetical protein
VAADSNPSETAHIAAKISKIRRLTAPGAFLLFHNKKTRMIARNPEMNRTKHSNVKS